MTFSAFKFLVVDDHILLRHVVMSALQPHGVKQLDWTLDGFEALEKIRAAGAKGAPYDVVLLDWNMPKMNGYEVLKSCRNDRALDGMAIVMVTAESDTSSMIKALEAGATAYVTKPFKPEVLVQKLEEVVQWRKKLAGKS